MSFSDEAMGKFKTIVCLANSRKKGGRCIVGKIWEKGGKTIWVRPVSQRLSKELTRQERCFENHKEPNLLDILTFSYEKKSPGVNQPENYLIDSQYYWTREGCLSWEDLEQLVDYPDSLWEAGWSSYSGKNDRFPENHQIDNSLYLISVKKLNLLVGKKAPEYQDSKRAVRGSFTYRGSAYLLSVTDPEIERIYLPKPDGDYSIKNPLICVSIGEPHNGYCYKFIAAVFYEERFS